jgi:2-dehydro-3-deoxyphosphogluconate aldolase/(4S)-4-hydroxy-2-oxoglutarate aldolase
MEKQQNIICKLTNKGLLPLYFYPSESISIRVLEALYNGGIRAVEYTNRGEEALLNFKVMKKVCVAEMPGLYLGIGTIKSGEVAKAFISNGADFIITPGLAEDVATIVQKENVLWIPGCMTPTDIMRAESLGAKMVKLFPSNVLGAHFVKAVKDVFPDILFMPTGGVDITHQSLSVWFAAGVSAVGIGSKLLDKKVIEEENYAAVSDVTANTLKTIAATRQNN